MTLASSITQPRSVPSEMSSALILGVEDPDASNPAGIVTMAFEPMIPSR